MKKNVSKNWYKFLSEAVQKQLNEISKEELEKTKVEKYLLDKEEKYAKGRGGDVSKEPLEPIFEGKKRFAIPFGSKNDMSPNDKALLFYISKVREQGWTVDLNEPFGYATKVVEKEFKGKKFIDKKRVKIGPLIMALSPAAADFWQKNNKFYTTKENELYFASNYMIVFSRVPIDLLRMSDHDGWSSCHSPSGNNRQEGAYFRCAVEEAVTGGAIAYIVNTKELEGIDLEQDEVFKDVAREVGGATPLSRLRIRRFINRAGDDTFELGVPEIRVYGQDFPGFYQAVARVVMDKQKGEVKKIKEAYGTNQLDLDDWTLFGGTYEDSSGWTLFTEFFGQEFKFVGDPRKNPSFVERQNATEQVNTLVKNHNQNATFTEVYAEIDYEENELTINFGGSITFRKDFGPKANEVFQKLKKLNYAQEVEIGDLLDNYYSSKVFGVVLFDDRFNKTYDFELDGQNIEISIGITPEQMYTVGDLEALIRQLRLFEYSGNLEKLADAFVFVLQQINILEDTIKAKVEAIKGTLQNFSRDYPMLKEDSIISKSNPVLIANYDSFLKEFYDKLKDVPAYNVKEISSNQIYEMFDKGIMSKLISTLYRIRIKENLRDLFMTTTEEDDIYSKDLPAGYGHLQQQQSLFNKPVENKKRPGILTRNIDIGIGPGFDITGKKFEMIVFVNLKGKKEEDVDKYLQYLKFIDRMMPRIRDIVFDLYRKHVDELFEGMTKRIESGRLPFEQIVTKYPESFDFTQNNSQVSGRSNVQESKEKLFKLDGSTWRMRR